jgi:hypothetical protein
LTAILCCKSTFPLQIISINTSSAASAIAANTFLRSIAAAGFPLFARQMFNNLGIQWAATLLGCLAALCVPIPVCFYLFGKKLRQKSKFAPTMSPPKKQDEEETGTDSDDGSIHDNQHGMSALHATRTAAHHDMPQRLRTRTRSDAVRSSAGQNSTAAADANAAARENGGAVSEKQE